MSATLENTQVIVGPVRFSYLNVFQPRRNELRNETEFSVVLLIPKENTPECPDAKGVRDQVVNAIKAALVDEFKAIPPKFDNPLKDGDAETDGEGKPKNPGYWFLNARCKEEYPPLLIDGARAKVTAENGWKSGDWGKVKIAAYGYDFQGRRGCGIGLRAIQFLRRGEAFGSAPTSADEFDVVEGSASAGEYDPFAEA